MAERSEKQSGRGLALASEETKERVAKAGGQAPHEKRGLQAASEEIKERVAKAGGQAPHEKRGLQAASEETRERVAKAGGSASGGGQSGSGGEGHYDSSLGRCRNDRGRFTKCSTEESGKQKTVPR
jgi:hypothetical protein